MRDEAYGINPKPVSVKNPQANAILERIHQVFANLCRTYELEEREMDRSDPWSGIISAVAWAIRSTYHTTLKATPGQLVFGRDMVLNITHNADWAAIKTRKQALINSNNKRENKKRIAKDYNVGDEVLLERLRARKYERPYDGPFRITRVYTNGTVQLQKGAVSERVNIRRIYPYNS